MTPEEIQAAIANQQADAWLNQQGSLMGSAKAGPAADRAAQGPLLATLSQLLNMFGPSPTDAGVSGAAAIGGRIRGLRPPTNAIDAKALMDALLRTGAGGGGSGSMMAELGTGGILPKAMGAARSTMPVVMPAVVPAAGAASSLPRMGKTYTQGASASGAPAGETYTQQLIKALTGYLDPAELTSAKQRLQPALHMTGSEPQIGKNLIIGPQASGHGPLYEAAGKSPVSHGYFDPNYNVFINDAVNTMLYDPSMLQNATKQLQGGTSLPDLMQALQFPPPSF